MKRLPAFLTFVLLLAWALPGGTAAAQAEENAYRQGLAALETGNSDEAIRRLTLAIEGSPTDYRYYNDRGVAYKRSGNLPMALADYTKALEIRPDYTNALNNRGIVYLSQGEYDKAIADFTAALKHGGLEATIFTNLGIAHARKGDCQAALGHFEKAVSYRPVDPRSFLFMADLFEKTGEKQKALKMYYLANGLVKEPTGAEFIRERIAALEKDVPPLPTARRILPAGAHPGHPARRETPPVEQSQVGSDETRDVRVAPRGHDGEITLRKQPPGAVESPVKTLEELEGRCRARAIKTFSQAAAEIYRQGVQFMEKSDTAKALVRFEDTRQLERRKKNAHGVAWCYLETGRAYLRMGDQLKAVACFEGSLNLFQKLKAKDETILATIELASAQKTRGQKDKASAYYSKAIHEANAVGYQLLASLIKDLAEGRSPAPTPPQRVAASAPRPAPPASDSRVTASPPQDQPRAAAPVPPASPPKVEARPAPPPVTPRTPPAVPAARSRVILPAPAAAPTEAAPPVATPAPQPQIVPQGRQRGQGAQPPVQVDELKRVGRGPLAWRETGPPAKPVRPVTPSLPPGASAPRAQQKAEGITLPRPEAAAVQPPTIVATRPDVGLHPEALRSDRAQMQVPPRKKAAIDRKLEAQRKALARRIHDDLVELGRLKRNRDEQPMIWLLERLADKYIRTEDYEKALHSLTASLALREKLLVRRGEEAVLKQSGLIKEKLGRQAEAVEDLTRAISATEPGHAVPARALEARVKKISKEMGVEGDALLRALRTLWEARTTGNERSETLALFVLGRLYDRANRPKEALNYYERSSASMLADKARIYERMGKSDQAAASYNQALEAFKSLDYSRYLKMKKARETRTL